MSERRARRYRQEMRKRFRTDFDDFTKLISTFSFKFRVWFCLELLFGRQYRRVKSIIKRKKRGE